jgi:transcriptional regulator with XRE-family HTH domain
MTQARLEELLILGPGWIRRFETGESVPSIDMLLAILHQLGAGLQDLLDGIPLPDEADVQRRIFAEQTGPNLTVHFDYAKFDARYTLPHGQLADFEAVIKTLRDGLAGNGQQNDALKADAVARAFLHAVRLWPEVNPSDLWWFVIYRAYCDPYNHPASSARLAFEQSWKRTGGWALEEILVRHYGPFLKANGVNMLIESDEAKERLVQGLRLDERVETDKIDVVLTGNAPNGPVFFGVVNVKASFAERRTDDVPLSEIMIRNGYTSPLWTMDCKSMPGATPCNHGELGPVAGHRSAKREDVETSGSFTGCFSYNSNTEPSPQRLPAERRVYVCDFRNPDDTFSRFILERWRLSPRHPRPRRR